MKIGYMCERSANAFYRVIFPLRALARRGHTIPWPEFLDHDLPMRELLSCDIVHCHRRLDRLEDLKTLSRHGVALCYDNDDNFAAAPVDEFREKLKATRRYHSVFKGILEAAQIANVTTTPSPILAEVYRAAGIERVRVIENRLPRTLADFGTPDTHTGVVVGWVAEKEHKAELDRLPIVEALRCLLDADEDAKLVTVGLRLPVHSARYRHISAVELPRLLTVTRTFDIGIAPLSDIEFNRSRSNIKLKEYSSGGAAWAASPVGPYANLGERQGGVLVADDEWVPVLGELVDNKRLRRGLRRKALKWAARETIERHAEEWERAFEDACSASTKSRDR